MTAQKSSAAAAGPTVERRQYAKSEGVRRRILEACIAAFGSAGFHGATMKDVAQRAQISQTGLNHHFPSKRDLLIQVLAERDSQMAAIMGDAAGEAFFERQVKILQNNDLHPGLIELHIAIAAEATSPDHPAHKLYRDRYADLRSFLVATFDDIRSQGRLRIASPSREIANLFVGALDGVQLQRLYDPSEVDVSASISALIDALIAPEAEDRMTERRHSVDL